MQYIWTVGALVIVSFTLLIMWERDIALIFFGILSGFFTNILSIKQEDSLDSEILQDRADFKSKPL